jgi:hypothetical protein
VPKRISSILGVNPNDFEASGAFDGFVDVDSKLHVDPHLLSSSSAPELKGARETFEAHFRGVLKLLAASKREDDVFWTEARRSLTFPEIPHTGLGYSK